MADLALDDPALLARCRVESCRSGGPGGQHANRTASAVRLVHLATGVEARCQDHREHARNVAGALAALRLRLAVAVRGAGDPAWLATVRQGSRLHLGPEAPSYPRVAAVLLDALAAHQGALAGVAGSLGLSTTQVAKLLTAHPEVRAAADAIRGAYGLGGLHVR